MSKVYKLLLKTKYGVVLTEHRTVSNDDVAAYEGGKLVNVSCIYAVDVFGHNEQFFGKYQHALEAFCREANQQMIGKDPDAVKEVTILVDDQLSSWSVEIIDEYGDMTGHGDFDTEDEALEKVAELMDNDDSLWFDDEGHGMNVEHRKELCESA